jgi:putative oxidoreductase
MRTLIFGTPIVSFGPSLGLLALRLVMGGFMFFGHGLGKLKAFSTLKDSFPDPLGIGSALSLGGAVASETLFAGLLMVGWATRLSTLPLIFTMLIAAFVVHGGDPLFMSKTGGSKEPALLFLSGYLALFFTGPGCLSLDMLVKKNKAKEDWGSPLT